MIPSAKTEALAKTPKALRRPSKPAPLPETTIRTVVPSRFQKNSNKAIHQQQQKGIPIRLRSSML